MQVGNQMHQNFVIKVMYLNYFYTYYYQFYWTRYNLLFIDGPEKNKRTCGKTGSKDILTWLKRLGHCISYAEVNRIETYLAEIESKNNENERFIPSNINHSSLLHLLLIMVIIIQNLYTAKVSTVRI